MSLSTNLRQTYKFQEYGYGDKTFVSAADLIVIVYLTRIPTSFLAIPLLQKFGKRPVYLLVSLCLLFIVSGLIVFTNAVVTESITKQEFQESIG